LQLDASAVDDEGLKHLAGATRLESLTLERLPVGDKSIETIKSLTGLKHLNIRRTGFTADGLKRLREAMPAVDIASDIETSER
jgi:hypothetical protein